MRTSPIGIGLVYRSLAEDGQRGLDLYKKLAARPDPARRDAAALSVFSECYPPFAVAVTPVIMVTAMGDEPEKLGALRYGADDYVGQALQPAQWARVHAVLRRTAGNQPVEHLLHENLRVDLVAFAAIEQGEAPPQWLDLTPTEFKLLVTLLKTPSRPSPVMSCWRACRERSPGPRRRHPCTTCAASWKPRHHRCSGHGALRGYRFR